MKMHVSRYTWFTLETKRENGQLIAYITFRRWHPGYWYHHAVGIVRRKWRYHIKPFFVDREWMHRGR